LPNFWAIFAYIVPYDDRPIVLQDKPLQQTIQDDTA